MRASICLGLASLGLAHPLLHTSPPPPPPPAPIVTTTCGPATGAVDLIKFNVSYAYRYSAIPYAAAPVGALRWRPPAPLTCPWPGILNATGTPNNCIHPDGSGNEDCLYLSVVTPAPLSPGSKLPVLVWFHGGNLIGGSISSQGGNEVIATQAPGGAIVVAVSYRLGVTGWLATADLAAEQGGSAGNYGAQDAIAALEWVRDNIAAFGGDPAHVSLFGQSSGGTLIFGLMAMPAAQGLFSAAFSMSGSPNITMGAQAKWAQDAPIVEALGCAGGATPAARLACLRALPASTVGKAMPEPWNTPGIWGWGWNGPTLPPPAAGGESYAGIIHVDGAKVVLPFAEALALGVNGNASLVISNMAAEPDCGPNTVLRNTSVGAWDAALAAALAGWPDAAAFTASVAGAYAAEAAVDPQLAFDSLASDYGLTCANAQLAVAAVKTGLRAAPTYLMYNAWPRSQANADGACRWPSHGLDLTEATWGWNFEPSPADWQASRLMQALLSDIARFDGRLPPSWGWPPVAAGAPPPTFVVAQNSSSGWPWPGGGVRTEVSWRQAQCGALAAGGLAGQEYWWCD